jgi:hypothetical protein
MNYYNPPRTRNLFQTGQSFSFSRSKVDLFMKCRHCFYLDRKFGVDSPPGFPFNINSAVDTLLKREFDLHRKNQTIHPLLVKSSLDFVPFDHPDIDIWRENFKGIRCTYKGYEFSGAVDDVWVTKKGELVIVDYKSTASSEPVVSIDKDYHIGYKRQVEFYQWILHKLGYNIFDTAYFVYCTGDNTKDSFDGNMHFNINLIPHKGDFSWVEQTLNELIECIENDDAPNQSEDCDYCKYFTARKSCSSVK